MVSTSSQILVLKMYFNTKTMTLGNNVKNLVILIPNEGHHAAGEDNEARFLDQHFVPENTVVNTGTTVQWFNGDAGHERTIDVKDDTMEILCLIPEKLLIVKHLLHLHLVIQVCITMKQKVILGVTMTGSVTVGNIQSPVTSSSSGSSNSSSGDIDTVGILMVPTQNIDSYIQQ